MSRFSKPQLETQASELNAQILAGLAEAGVKAESNDYLDGIKIPEYQYDIVRVEEKTSGYGISIHKFGVLVVVFRSIHMGRGTLCHAKKFKADTKDLIKKVVESVKERRNAIIALNEREKSQNQARRSHERTLKQMRHDYPEFRENIEHHPSQINLSFHDLNEAEARLILVTLRSAGIHASILAARAEELTDVQSED